MLRRVGSAIVAGAMLCTTAHCDPFGASASDGADASTPAPRAEAGSLPTRNDAGPGAGPAGHALSLDGSGFVGIDNLQIGSNYTVEAWIDPSSPVPAHEQMIVAKDQAFDPDVQFRLALTPDVKLYFIAADENADGHGLIKGASTPTLITAALTPGVWTHVAVTKAGKKMALLLNGATAASLTLSADFTTNQPNDIQLRIGARYAQDPTKADGSFVGLIDDVRVWSVGRSASDIQGAMRAPPPPSTSGLLAAYPFSEGVGSTTASTTGDDVGMLEGGAGWTLSTAY